MKFPADTHGMESRLGAEAENVLDLCPYLLTSGAVDDARQIFALSEPVDLLKSPSDNTEASLEDRAYELEIWAAAAIHFRPTGRNHPPHSRNPAYGGLGLGVRKWLVCPCKSS